MKIICIIPARSGSKSIPLKNITPLGEHPLLAYSIAASRLSQYIEETVLSTDSIEIADMGRRYGAKLPFLRPKEISMDTSLDIDFFKHYLEFIISNNEVIPDLIVHLRPTTPMREIHIIDAAIDFMTKKTKATSLRSAHKTHLTPYKMFRLKGEFMEPFLHYEKEREFYNLPRQIFEDCFLPNGYVDIVRPSVILDSGMLHGEHIKLWETYPTADIDSISDLDYAESLLKETRFKPLKEFLEKFNDRLS